MVMVESATARPAKAKSKIPIRTAASGFTRVKEAVKSLKKEGRERIYSVPARVNSLFQPVGCA
jgi:hypothetical protein